MVAWVGCWWLLVEKKMLWRLQRSCDEIGDEMVPLYRCGVREDEENTGGIFSSSSI
jgi:hypothetical protein